MAAGVYFRTLLIGYFEGQESERGIAWRLADSLSLRGFLGYSLDEKTPDHSMISGTRRLYWLETHKAIFKWAIGVLTGEGLIQGQTTAIDATTLGIVRRDNGQSYNDYLKDLAKTAGIEDPKREELARMDRKRKKKGSSDK
jgi:transposase